MEELTERFTVNTNYPSTFYDERPLVVVTKNERMECRDAGIIIMMMMMMMMTMMITITQQQ